MKLFSFIFGLVAGCAVNQFEDLEPLLAEKTIPCISSEKIVMQTKEVQERAYHSFHIVTPRHM